MKFFSGELTITTGGDVTGRVGGNVTVDCNIKGPEPSSVTWIKFANNIQITITIDNNRYSGGTVDSPALTINNLNTDDAAQYQCTAKNPGGNYHSTNKATVTVMCK